VIGLRISKAVSVEDSKEDKVLVGQDDEDAQEESHGEGSGKSFQDKGSQDGQENVHQSGPNAAQHERAASALVIEIEHWQQ
jgi:hypothetical protein